MFYSKSIAMIYDYIDAEVVTLNDTITAVIVTASEYIDAKVVTLNATIVQNLIDAKTYTDEQIALVDVSVFVSRLKAYCQTTVSVPTNTYTKVPLNLTVYDVNSELDTTLNRFVCKVAGEYSVKGQVMLSSMADGERMSVTIYLNGAGRCSQQFVPVHSASSWTAILATVSDIHLEVDDYLELWVFQSGSARNIGIGIQQTWMAVHQIG